MLLKRSLLSLLAAAVLVSSCAHPQKPASTPSPIPTAPTGSPAPQASPSPYGFTYTPSPQVALDLNAPQIKEIDLNDHILAAPGPVRVRVLTSEAVSSVIARTMGHELAVPQIAPGIFGADDRLPNIPFFLRNRTYGVDFIATSRDGRTANIVIPVTIR